MRLSQSLSFERAEALTLPRLVSSWLLSTAVVALAEWLLLLTEPSAPFHGWLGYAALLVLGFGNLLPYSALVIGCWKCLEWIRSRMEPRIRHAPLTVGVGVGLVLLPYSIGVARYTFSGPQASGLPLHDSLVAGSAFALTMAFISATLLQPLRPSRRGARFAYAGGFTAAACALVYVNRAVYAHEYEPLHVLVGWWVVILSTFVGLEVARWLPIGARRWRLVFALSVAHLVTSGLVLPWAHQYSWAIWGKTAVSRYITSSWTVFRPRAVAAASSGAGTFRSQLESEQAKQGRRHRFEALAPHIVLFSLDGLRPDHLGAYGYRKHPTSPTIDRFAQRGVRFTRAYSSFPKTQCFNSSLLLGRFLFDSQRHDPPRALQEVAITRLLKRRNYHILVNSWFEFSSNHSFDPRDYAIDTHIRKATRAEKLKARRMPYLPMEWRFGFVQKHLDEAKKSGEPVFLWMHLLGTHPINRSFTPHPEFPFGESRSDLYDSAIAGTERWLGRLETMMQETLGDERPTIWIITADHSIGLEQRGRALYQDLVHVPLIIVAPEIEARTAHCLVDVSLDLAATIVDFAGVAPPASYDGLSLIPILENFAVESVLDSRVIPLVRDKAWRGGVYRDFKHIEYRGALSLFDLAKDPEEQDNLAAQQPAMMDHIAAIVDAELTRRKERMAADSEADEAASTDPDSEEE